MPCCPWSYGLLIKSLHVSLVVPEVPVRAPSKWPLARVSGQSRLSANDKGGNWVKPGAGHRSPGIYLTGEETDFIS